MLRKIASFAALTAVLGFVACAAPGGGSGLTVPPIAFEEYTLGNGLRVITSKDETTPNVTVQVFYDVGAKEDPLGRSGFAHLFEHIMFKATENMPNETLDRFTEDVGGFNNATTYDDFTAYYEVVPSGHLERLLWAEAERMSSLVIDEANFNSERDVVKEELRQNYLADPYGRLFGLMLYQATYAEHPYRRPGIGSIEELDAATIDDIRAFHREYYRPDNATLIVIGNFDEAQLRNWVEEHFGAIENPEVPMTRNDAVEPARSEAAVFHGFGPNVPLPALAITWLGVEADHPDAAPLKVLDAILSAGRSSRLYNSLVYEQQIAVEAFSLADLPEDPGMFALGAVMSSGNNIDDGEAALLAEIRALQETPPTDAELAEAKNELIASALRERETINDRAFAIGYALMVEGDAEAVNEEIPAIQAVTSEDVQRVARTYLDEDLRMTIRYLPETEAGAVQATIVPPAPQVASVPFDGPVFELRPEAEREAPPPVTPAASPTLPSPSERTLGNGLRVIVAPSDKLPLVTAQLIVNVGAWADPDGLAGAASMTADLLTEGAGELSAAEVASQAESLGATLTSSGGAETASVYLNVTSDQIAPAMALMASVATDPALAEEELERQRSQALDNLTVAYREPGSVASFAASPVVFAGTPFGHVTGGTPASITAFSIADLRAIHEAFYRPDNAILVLAGDVTPAEGFALAQEAFGEWTAPAAAAPEAPVVAANAPPRAIIIDIPGQDQTAVTLVKPGIARSDPDFYPSLVTNAILGQGYSSRLNQEIRLKRGLSYGAGSSFSTRKTTGAFLASAQTRNPTAPQVLELMIGELNRLRDEPVGTEEMTARKSVVVGGFGRRLETTDGLAGVFGDLAFYGLPLDEISVYTEKVEAVSAADVQAFARRMLNPADASVVIAGAADQFDGDLTAPAATAFEVIAVDDLNLDSPDLR
jgi:zinc protease